MSRSFAPSPDQGQAEFDVEPALSFLAALAPGETRFQFQTFDDNPDRSLKRAKLSWTGYGSLDEHSAWLREANDQFAAVCVTVNQTDGSGRAKKNMVGVRALMLDLDGAPLAPVRECTLKPHIIIETSPDRYHVFWRIEGLSLDDFASVQRGLAERFDGDPMVASVERCTRLPGFLHCKDVERPFRVEIVEMTEGPAYTAEEVMREFPPREKPHATPQSAVILPPGAPLEVAEAFLQALWSTGEHRLLHCHRDQFYRYTGTHYRSYSGAEIERDLYAFLRSALVSSKDGKTRPYNPTKAKVADVVHALKRSALIDSDCESPCWLGNQNIEPAGDLVVCQNGILNLKTRELTPHNPDLFATTCLPLAYDASAPKLKRWVRLLEELWPGEFESQEERTLQEVFGYLLTSDTRQQKLFLIFGPKRAGKGTLIYVLSKLLGDDNIVHQTLADLGTGFGRWPLIDKKLAVIDDARIGSTDTQRIAELLLSISGGDPQTINRKNQSFWTGRLSVRFLITTNELPALRDASGTIASRFIPLKLENSFFGKEDIDLKDKLLPELPAILNWALDGLDRLRKRGYFKIPQSSEEAIRELEDLASPVGAFVREWCEVNPMNKINVKELYQAYKLWAHEAGHKTQSNITFGRSLRSVIPKLAYQGAGRNRRYVGIALSETAQEQVEELGSAR